MIYTSVRLKRGLLRSSTGGKIRFAKSEYPEFIKNLTHFIRSCLVTETEQFRK